MRSPAVMQTIQIELTSACVLKCSNCTRFCGTHRVPFFMEFDDFKQAIDSLVEFAGTSPYGIVGFMGGEPLLHPQFEEFCDYALSKFPRRKLGLWSTFPGGEKYANKYREVICKTFGNILLNDHSRDDILHAPVLVASEDVFRKQCPTCSGKGGVPVQFDGQDTTELPVCQTCHGSGNVTDDETLFAAVDHCWIQESWSAAINPKGAWFCEVAAALSDLFDGPEGWKVEPGWWKRTPPMFMKQMDWACRKCGAALPLTRIRNSQDPKDDVSKGNLERLKEVKSRKVARGEFNLRENYEFDQKLIEGGTYPSQTYKEFTYRQGIAHRYGITLTINDLGYWEPNLIESMPKRATDTWFTILNNEAAAEAKAQ